MDRPGVFAAALFAVGAVLVAIAIAQMETEARDASGFAVAGGMCLTAGVLAVVIFHGLQPLLIRLAHHRRTTAARYARSVTPASPASGAIAAPHGSAVAQLAAARRQQESGPGLVIDGAEWGPDGAEGVEVTDALARQLADGRIVLAEVSNDALGGDPFPDVPKVLTVYYRVDNRPLTQSFREGVPLELP